ncbi:hypothetical protein ElyMa_001625400 [Elysia marginata]|uniref:Uncharacterized protein n=1 Tax=Elysia marginata TaxID=1093978 RepID=A0AAV4JQI3_9GAST|nr:hypothetical protein ElyMa_001625400 [Elysia marginata]
MGLAREISLLMTKQAREKTVSLLSTSCACVCPIDYGPCKRDKLTGDKASEGKDSFFVIHVLCVCVCPIDYGPCKRDKLTGDKASERKDSFFVIHVLCVCVCPIDYGPCTRDTLVSVLLKDTGGARGVKQSAQVK